ncbi:MAG: N-acetylmuramoyl-L-alanine amidase [Parvibaculum sp.]|jgi:N-acetylmuramoyl-L-alanine amidase|uniref:N-acetylmuramoyl-L-alanine amidase n=1 Tax=Parvibaculum sp. TaxID=2024848 RepID=UPI000C6821EA|nr:N-acetylmuramoyl-L-alanine amidase [Parvibaculum sp.]MAU60600.1 N-acetylmuramoyl-L-alanine amidase [Parvibaculum sp.]HAC58661.1 N-acetylmuramoyl-L-alanine amidase [Rhodobiaceae bacterium]
MGFHRQIERGVMAGFGLVAVLCLLAGFASSPARADDLAELLERELREASIQQDAAIQQENDALSTGALDEGGAVPLAPSSAAPAQGGPAVTSIRIGDHGSQTRFVMEISGDAPADYRVFTLSDPFRVVIDVKGVPFRLVEEPADKHKGFVSGYRYGRFEADTYRVVLDAELPVEISRDFVLDPQSGFGRRIVLDLAPTDLASFNAKSGLPESARPAAPAAEIAAVPVSPPAERLERRRVVVIDAGHGGVDPGTHGRSGVQEKDVVLAFAKKFAEELRSTGRYDVHLTRDSDIFIPLRERVAIARRHKADLFISVHADAIQKPNVRGMSIYTLSETASDKEAAALARKENQSDLIAGLDLQGESPEVTGILIDLAQRETKNYSSRFARTVVDYASQKTRTLDPAHRFAGFVVLKAPDVPSVLIELGFLTNPEDEKQLVSPAWRATMAKTLSRSVDRYFGDRLAEGPN